MLTLLSCIAGAGVCAVFAWFILKDTSAARRRLTEAPRRGCGEAIPGPAKFQGRAMTGEPLISPHSETPCVYYRVVVSLEQMDNRHSTSRRAAEQVAWADDWWLEDETGSLRVNTTGARVYPSSRESRNFVDHKGDAIARAYGVDPGLFERVIVHEELIPVGAKLFAFGEVRGDPPVLAGGGGLVLSVGNEAETTELESTPLFGWLFALAAAGLLIFGVANWLEEQYQQTRPRPAPYALPATPIKR